MYVRLAFSVAAHLESEILAIDEVLAVGDAEFQSKCLGKMHDVADHGRTVLYVSHQLQTVVSLCTSAVFLERGRMILHGSVDDALQAYRSSFERTRIEHLDANRRPGNGELRFMSAQMSKEVYESSDDKTIEFAVSANNGTPGNYFVSCHINDEAGQTVLQCDSRLMGFWLDPAQEQRATLKIGRPWLKPGRYTVDLFACRAGVLDAWEVAEQFEILPMLPYPAMASSDSIKNGVVFADFTYQKW
jgi:lipopolysaccharide transport system ATP-binding protein